jgi:hypothetical protein
MQQPLAASRAEHAGDLVFALHVLDAVAQVVGVAVPPAGHEVRARAGVRVLHREGDAVVRGHVQPGARGREVEHVRLAVRRHDVHDVAAARFLGGKAGDAGDFDSDPPGRLGARLALARVLAHC